MFALSCPDMYTVNGAVSGQEHSLKRTIFFTAAVHRGSILPAVVADASEDVSYCL